MAKSKWILLLLSGFVSTLSVINLSISLSTDHWVVAEAKFDGDSMAVENSKVSYGLFDGKLSRYYLNSFFLHDLRIVCNYGINKCFYSCQHTNDNREDEFRRLLNDEKVAECPKSVARFYNEQVNTTTTTTITTSHGDDDVNLTRAKAAKYETEFLSAGLWLTTVIFLGFSIAFALLSCFFSMLNVWFHPAHRIFSVFGLYIWNGIAAVCCTFTMIFWISIYFIFIATNIAITDTLRSNEHYTSTNLASLGVSYWIVIISIVCHLINIGLIYYRNYLLMKEPKPAAITVHKNDTTMMVY